MYERLWHRPALTVIGIDGHPIKGSSNQIVREAAARISIRVGRRPGPAPAERGARATTSNGACRSGSSSSSRRSEATPAWRCEPEGPAFDAAERALRDGVRRRPVYMGVGGTIPFVGPFAEAFGGIPALLLGPADPGSRIHGEDESLHLGDWANLIDAEVRLLSLL